jgi:hypothetical protein
MKWKEATLTVGLLIPDVKSLKDNPPKILLEKKSHLRKTRKYCLQFLG